MATYRKFEHPVYSEKVISDSFNWLAFFFPILWSLFQLQWGLLFTTVAIQSIMGLIMVSALDTGGLGYAVGGAQYASDMSALVANIVAWICSGFVAGMQGNILVMNKLERKGFKCTAEGRFETLGMALATWAETGEQKTD